MRHARAVFLLGGWLLMYPPVPGSKAPITSWEQYGAHDTAEGCELERVYAMKHTGGKLHDQLLDARCVPTEAVYPPKK